MDYCLDAGDGTVSIWSGGAGPDTGLDMDGDGLFDDLLTDTDEDGSADQAALDLDDDGLPEALYSDDGSGTWALGVGGQARPLRWFGLDGSEHTHTGMEPADPADPAGPPDVDGDGRADRLLDIDRDGQADRALRVSDDGGVHTGYADTDGDGRWDVMLTDTDGDGAADAAGRI